MQHARSRMHAAALSAVAALTMLVSALFVATPQASAAYSDCPGGKVCLFQGYGTGAWAVYDGSDLGCKTHEGVNPLGIYNHTGNKYVSVPGQNLVILPGQIAQFPQPVTGLICIQTN